MRAIAPIVHLLSIILLMFAATWWIPMGVAYYFDEPCMPFAMACAITLTVGAILFTGSHHSQAILKRRDGFIVVTGAWLLLCLCCALPFWFSTLQITPMDALFEAVSGFTTTGAEVITHIERWPKSLLFYHQWLQFLGGLGIIILGMALIPMLQSNHAQWMLAEISSSNNQTRITPMLHDTARALWGLYTGFTLLCFCAYLLAGMPWFEAICYSFSTVSTGGFAIHDQSIGHYHLPAVPWIASFFMLIGSISFALHFRTLHARSIKAYFANQELRVYLFLILAMIVLCISYLGVWGHTASFSEIVFTTLAMISTTGLTMTDFSAWPYAMPYILMLIATLGGCCGSTTGGIKIARLLIFLQEARRALFALIHPNAVTTLHLEGQPVDVHHLNTIRGFLAIFIMIYIVLILFFMNCGYDFDTAFAAISACLSNVGASIHPISQSYDHLNDTAKAVLMFTMITGRLEILTLLVLFTPSFWTDKAMA